ncbi:DUF5107 domain-containing protein [Chitinophaga parva]|uniref:DUF5107 domain-containing protein n=1 Tax=Chitinophaga parva TaxID=2169414 RepID=A0A2T7BE54_9BACT|nr:DUF5107 domain-containing protein [Chitinophaga parva]PUZ23374.1 DUF5107 domain-containing protein [Chitinophaga parva]
MREASVSVWQEQVIIPTYGTGKPDKNPMFFEKRVYQGSSGVVYPNPVIEKICDEKADKAYTGLFLENEYLKIMILPELGGRIQMAYDKIRQRHFIYYNQVIKPALVGLTGPWISGGIEFNWPQHHRPSTFDPVDFKLEEHADGSKTVWVNEVERMFHTKGMVAFTLHPGKAYLEINAQLYNRSALPQTFLWWANPAVKVNDHYQSVFPPDVNAVFDHGKRDVATFPIATGTYYKVDYAPGTDISLYKNIPVPTSYMAIRSDYDFVGGYEHDTQAGLLHVANHHVSPGKKQWTWGHGDFGQAWDRNLTDEDGPYIELMTGVFTDNQPDFSWLMPYEQKSFTQYFLPYRDLGVVKNASKDILLSVQGNEDGMQLKVFGTSLQKQVMIQVYYDGKPVYMTHTDLKPEHVFIQQLPLVGTYDEQKVEVCISSETQLLLRYAPAENRQNEIPEPAKPAQMPAEMESTEQLFLTGQHLEQYRHATYSPVPYYEEALRREPGDARNNNALGVWYLRRGKFAASETYFRTAIATITRRNPNPYDSEPYYNLGLCLQFQGRYAEAYEAFYKATWSRAWKDAGYFSVAQLDLRNGVYASALVHAQQSLDHNANNSKAYVLKALALRKLGRAEEAQQTAQAALQRDPFNLGALYELQDTARLKTLARGDAQNYLAYALDYAAAGAFREAIGLLSLALQGASTSPMVYYTLAWLYAATSQPDTAQQWLQQAASADPYLCFPNRLEEIAVLEYAIAHNTADGNAPYYLGNLFYDKRQYSDAVAYWELSAAINGAMPTVHRNLGIAYFNKQQDAAKALASYEKAFALDRGDARILMELDQLYKRLGRSPQERLQFLEAHLGTVLLRDDLYLERVTLYNLIHEPAMALELLLQRKFHPWEGGEGKASGQYVYSLVQLAIAAIRRGEPTLAVQWLEQAQQYPYSLGEGKLYGTQENDIFYWLGCAYEALQQPETAASYFHKATEGLSEPTAAIFYNDQQPDKICYQGLAWEKLHQPAKAKAIFEKLVAYGKQHLHDTVSIDYFAVSLPDLLIFEDDLQRRNQVHCHYITGLGLWGLHEPEAAVEAFSQALALDAAHAGAYAHLALAKHNTGATVA